MILAEKLQVSDEIRIVAPARSISIMSLHDREYAKTILEQLGLKVTFGKQIDECDEFGSSSIESRIADLHEAFTDNKVKAIFSVIGGYNSNQLLDYLDYELIRSNPKIICGYSDITALLNAIYAKTGLITYCGPHYSTFGAHEGNNYTIDYFLKCLFNKSSFDVKPSDVWSDDLWYFDQNKRNFIKNSGIEILNEGCATGTIVGGNLCTFNLLMGTSYLPSLTDAVLFIEDDNWPAALTAQEFDRNLQALIHLPTFHQVKAIIIGRFQLQSEMNFQKLKKIIHSKSVLDNIPIICNVDFGHTHPMITFPIGGTVEIKANNNNVCLQILQH